MKIELSDSGTLIIPVPKERFAELPDILPMGKQVFYKKAEHHMTVFNYPIGKFINRVIQEFPQLRNEINLIASVFEWNFGVNSKVVMYLNNLGASKSVKTIVSMVFTECINRFYSATTTLLDRAVHEAKGSDSSKLDVIEKLRALLRLPPPPHITIYTSDPEGKKGIGLNSYMELEAAIENGALVGPSNSMIACYMDPELIW